MKLLSVAIALVAFAGQSPSARVTGSWTAQFDGRTYVRLDLKAANGTVDGGISLGSIEVDKDGALKQVGEAPRQLTPIFDVSATNTSVRFARKDGDDTDRFELRTNESGQAELLFLLTARQLSHLANDGIPPPKPLALTRQ